VRSVLLYLLLVGTPLLGVFELLRIGQRLTPPISVAGTWTVERSATDFSVVPNERPRLGPTILTITQSGPHLVVVLNDDKGTTLEGEILGSIINAGVSSRSATLDASTSAPTDLLFHAVVDRSNSGDRLLGDLSSIDRPSLSFIATRERATKTTGGK
jgi:hypothetical protein